VEGVRFVRDGNLVTTAGVISGIEISLWLVERSMGRISQPRRGHTLPTTTRREIGRGEIPTNGAASSRVFPLNGASAPHLPATAGTTRRICTTSCLWASLADPAWP
jgi:hypothetical protein